MSTRQTSAPPKKAVSLRTILLIVSVAMVTTFAVMNRALVYVWPLGQTPVYFVIGISFVLGALTGYLVRSLSHRRVLVERELD